MDKKIYHCGPYNWPDWVKRLFSYWFNDECGIHDKNYAEGKLSKEEYDLIFFGLMAKKSNGSLIKCLVAFLFYYAVYKYGKNSWDRNRNIYKN